MKPLFWDAIDPATGLPYTWDHPNLRWRDPSYILEPGDPGYTPPFSPTTQRQPKSKKMKHNAYYPTNVPEQIIWLTNFFNKLIGHAASLGVSTAECAAAVADARWLIYLLGSWQPAKVAWAKSCTDAVREAQTGSGTTPFVLPVFTPPPLPPADAAASLPAVVAVNPGALNRLFDLVQVMKKAPNYNDTLATDLGTLGSELTLPDLATLQPEFTAKLTGTQVFIDWGWGGNGAHLDMLQLQVDRGTGWADLAYDTTPGYTDTHPLPAVLTKWKYRAIYRVGDAQVGLWSATVEIAVGG